MINKINKNKDRLKRHKRVRRKISGTAEAPRLSVYRTLNHIYAQLIDDVKGNTLVTASTLDKELKGTFEYDGMVHCRLTLKPGEQVNELTLRMPMTKEASELLHFVGATDRIGGDYGPSSPKGSNTFELSQKPGTVWTKRFGHLAGQHPQRSAILCGQRTILFSPQTAGSSANRPQC